MKKITAIIAVLMLTIFMAACAPATKSGTQTPEAVGTLETAPVEPSDTTGNVDELIAMVNDFVASGDITDQAENGLLAKLESIQQKLMDGEVAPAVNEMGAFVNEVQAQLGKKISEPAATALIAKAQEVAAELMPSVPVTGGEVTATPATTVPPTSQATESTSGSLTQPTPMGDPLEHQAQWDAIARQVAQSVGFTTFDYDLYQLPVNSVWEDTLAYYTTEAALAGWGDAPSQTDEMSGGHFAVWSVTAADGTTNYFVVAQVDAPDASYTLNILGSK